MPNARNWPGLGTVLQPRREPREGMQSPSSFAVTYAHIAIDRRPGEPEKSWNTTSMTQQLGVRGFGKKQVLFAPNAPIINGFVKSFEGLPFGANDEKRREVNIVNFGAIGNPVYNGDILFAIIPRTVAIDVTDLLDSGVDAGKYNGRGAYRGFRRDTSSTTKASLNLGGIKVTTGKEGDDLVLPSGPGQFAWIKFNGFPTAFSTIVDRERTLVNVGNGQDVAIGGYGKGHLE